VIPANEHGNIEIWGGNLKYVPAGATFIDHPFAVKAAKSLNINYVPALVGFESKGLVTIPKIGGIVVLENCVQLLYDALFEMTAFRNELQYNKKEEEVLEKWARLTRRILTRDRLRLTYGH
jgi:xeroderma pigmentosum group C-complementing protein